MSSTLIVPVRKALCDAVAELDAFVGKPVMFAYKPVTERVFAYTRAARFTHSPAAMRAGRNFRAEEASFEFVIWYADVGGSPEDACQKALDLGLVFEEFVADHKSGFAGTTWLLIDGDGELGEAVDDRSSYAEVVYPVKYQARLT